MQQHTCVDLAGGATPTDVTYPPPAWSTTHTLTHHPAHACRNGWSGIIINGCIRDSEDIGKMPLGVKALATYPLKSAKRDKGLRDVPVSFAGATVKPGDWVYADKASGAGQHGRQGKGRKAVLQEGESRSPAGTVHATKVLLNWQRYCGSVLHLQDGIIVSPEELTL